MDHKYGCFRGEVRLTEDLSEVRRLLETPDFFSVRSIEGTPGARGIRFRGRDRSCSRATQLSDVV